MAGWTHGGSSRSQRCVAGRVRRRPVERRPRQSVAETWRSGGRSVNRQGRRGGWSGEGLVELVVVVVMVLSRARQCSEERDFGNEWPDGRAPVFCRTVKSPVRQIRAASWSGRKGVGVGRSGQGVGGRGEGVDTVTWDRGCRQCSKAGWTISRVSEVNCFRISPCLIPSLLSQCMSRPPPRTVYSPSSLPSKAIDR